LRPHGKRAPPSNKMSPLRVLGSLFACIVSTIASKDMDTMNIDIELHKVNLETHALSVEIWTYSGDDYKPINDLTPEELRENGISSFDFQIEPRSHLLAFEPSEDIDSIKEQTRTESADAEYCKEPIVDPSQSFLSSLRLLSQTWVVLPLYSLFMSTQSYIQNWLTPRLELTDENVRGFLDQHSMCWIALYVRSHSHFFLNNVERATRDFPVAYLDAFRQPGAANIVSGRILGYPTLVLFLQELSLAVQVEGMRNRETLAKIWNEHLQLVDETKMRKVETGGCRVRGHIKSLHASNLPRWTVRIVIKSLSGSSGSKKDLVNLSHTRNGVEYFPATDFYNYVWHVGGVHMASVGGYRVDYPHISIDS